MGLNRRDGARKSVGKIEICDLTSMSSYLVIAKTGHIVDASTGGFLLHITRNNIVQTSLRENLCANFLVGEPVVLFLPQMNLDLDGTIIRAKHIGKGVFEVGVEFNPEIPNYWRECLVELLPDEGTFSTEIKAS